MAEETEGAGTGSVETPTDIEQKLTDLNAKAFNGGLTPTDEAEADRLYDLMAEETDGAGTGDTGEQPPTTATESSPAGQDSAMAPPRFLGADQPIGAAETPADIEKKLYDLNAKAFKEGRLTPADEAEADRLYDLRERCNAV